MRFGCFVASIYGSNIMWYVYDINKLCFQLKLYWTVCNCLRNKWNSLNFVIPLPRITFQNRPIWMQTKEVENMWIRILGFQCWCKKHRSDINRIRMMHNWIVTGKDWELDEAQYTKLRNIHFCLQKNLVTSQLFIGFISHNNIGVWSTLWQP